MGPFHVICTQKKQYRLILDKWFINNTKNTAKYPPHENQADIEECLLNEELPNESLAACSSTETEKPSNSPSETLSNSSTTPEPDATNDGDSTDDEYDGSVHKKDAHRENDTNVSDRQLLILNREINKIMLNKINRVLCYMDALEKRLIRLEERRDLGQRTINTRYVEVENTTEDIFERNVILSTDEEFNEFEERLKEGRFKNRVIDFMYSLGGKNYTELTTNILERFVSNNVAKRYNMRGKKRKNNDNIEKKAFKDTMILQCIIKSARKKCNSNEKFDEAQLLKTTIATWLSQAPLRHTREIQKEQKNEENNTRNDPLNERILNPAD